MSRYSLLYIERRAKQQDSIRARRRIAARCSDFDDKRKSLIYSAIKKELGYSFRSGAYSQGISLFLQECDLLDFLDAITIIAETHQYNVTGLRYWLSFVQRVFTEENLAYRMDAKGIVHPFVDSEFQINQSAALEALNEQRFGEARTDYEAAFRHLRNREGKAAIRSMFPAVETAAKVLCPGTMARLMPNEIDRHFLPKLRQVYVGNQPSIDAGTQLLQGMKDWITAAQPYRHGQEVQEPAEPPMEFVVAFLSAGAVYLRWFIELYASERPVA
jgi:hypothetical protein